jgi:2-keto-3-deoxygluconate permease
MMIPVFAFTVGSSLDLVEVWQAGLLGLGLGLAVAAIPGAALFVADRLIGNSGVAGVAAASTAVTAAAVPTIVAAANPMYAPAAAHAPILVAASVIVTTMFVPLLTAWVAAHVRKRRPVACDLIPAASAAEGPPSGAIPP